MKTQFPKLILVLIAGLFAIVSCGTAEFPWGSRIKCEFKTGGYIWATPAVTDGVAYFGSHDGYIYAVDVNNCREKWKFKTSWKVFSPARVENGIVYEGDTRGIVYALNAKTGELIWKFDMASHIIPDYVPNIGRAIFSDFPPVIYDDRLYFEGQAYFPQKYLIFALDLPTGQEVSSWEGRKFSLVDGILYFDGLDKSLVAMHAKTGIIKWKFSTASNVSSTTAVKNEVAYFGDEDSRIYAVDILTGQQKWRSTTSGKGESIMFPPLIVDDTLYVVSNKYLFAIDSASGKHKWTFGVKGDVSRWAGPVWSNGVIYVTSMDGHLYALDASTGQEKWKVATRFCLRNEMTTLCNQSIQKSPTVVGNSIYYGSDDGYFYAIDVR